MKKQLIISKVVNIICLVLFVVVLPLICSFIPYRQPVLTALDISPASSGIEYNYVAFGEIKNPTVVELKSVHIKVGFYDADGNFIGSKEIEVDRSFGSTSTTTFEAPFIFASTQTPSDYMVEDLYYTYEKLNWYFYFCIGIVLYGLISLLFCKQKHYFEVDGNKAEAYVGPMKLALVINGNVVKETTQRGHAEINYTLNDKMIRVQKLPSFLSAKVNIFVEGRPATITKARQNAFIKVVDKGTIPQPVNNTTPDKDNLELIVCEHCGTANDKSNEKCSGCGADLKK